LFEVRLTVIGSEIFAAKILHRLLRTGRLAP
jgi:hypothetical protein